jgi:hypothetical protein
MAQTAAVIAAIVCTLLSNTQLLNAGAAPTKAIPAQVKNAKGFKYADHDDMTSPSSSHAGTKVKAIENIIPVNM